MTNEEAIMILKAMIDEMILVFDRDRKKALNMAIEALKAQPETSTEIQEILNYLDTTLHPIVSPDNWYVYAELHDMVSMLPSVQSEIIYCKDCKHIQKWRSEESAKKFGQIYECARNVLNCPKPEDFCSRAERKE